MAASDTALTQEGTIDMHYTILIYETPAEFAKRSDPQTKDAYWRQWPPYSQALKDAGVFVGGSGLQPPETATTLKGADGQRQVQDGPYADTKEQLGGFYIIDVPDLDAALEWAARCPGREGKTLEIRPNLPPRSEASSGVIAGCSMCPMCFPAAAAALIASGTVSLRGSGNVVLRDREAATRADNNDPTIQIEGGHDDPSPCRVAS